MEAQQPLNIPVDCLRYPAIIEQYIADNQEYSPFNPPFESIQEPEIFELSAEQLLSLDISEIKFGVTHDVSYMLVSEAFPDPDRTNTERQVAEDIRQLLMKYPNLILVRGIVCIDSISNQNTDRFSIVVQYPNSDESSLFNQSMQITLNRDQMTNLPTTDSSSDLVAVDIIVALSNDEVVTMFFPREQPQQTGRERNR